MIISNLTKLHYRKKLWLTPKHPLCFEPEEFKLYYSAAVIIQAQLNENLGILHNFELERLMKKGLNLSQGEISQAMNLSREQAGVIEYLLEYQGRESFRYYLLMDCINVGMGEEGVSDRERESLRMFARMFDISESLYRLLYQFIQAAYREEEAECRMIYQQMEERGLGLSLMDLKYYLMTLYDTFECTQELLEKKKELHLVDRCLITQDLVIKPGMRLIIDHAIVRIYGNIALQGGELTIENSKLIRKSGSHRACINIHREGDVRVADSQIDCRNQGMFLRAEDGRAVVERCEIYNTTRGAAIRFWGQELKVSGTFFHHCYSGEDGGGIMFQGGIGGVFGCRFRNCEARRGGAVYGMEKLHIQNCTFEKCYVAEYGAAVFYKGKMENYVTQLQFSQCYPKGAEAIQYLSQRGGLHINEEEVWHQSTILDCPMRISSQGSLRLENITLYLNYPIQCKGRLAMQGTRLISDQLEKGDMIVLEHAQGCQITDCEFDGRGKTSGILATGTKIAVRGTMFRNTNGGRAIYNALSPLIEGSTFNYCQSGGILSQGGIVRECLFVNCRDKNGAGVTMLGKMGRIEQCSFVRCSADHHGGGIDSSLGIQIQQCHFKGCRPNNY